MFIIQPAEISGKIMSLIDEAESKMVIISPYNKISNWKKLIERIKKAQARGVEITWYIRKGIIGNSEQILHLGITPIEVENLHCKIYFNENHAVVTSMNLHEFSDNLSIDIGYYITDKTKLDELLKFIKIHIDSGQSQQNTIRDNINTIKSFDELLLELIDSFRTSYSELHVGRNKYGTLYTLTKFKRDYSLIFEPHSDYLRLDLRIELPYKTKQQVYYKLESKAHLFKTLYNEEIDFGNQMKRLKSNLALPNGKVVDKLDHNDFKILGPRIKNIIEMYLVELD